jgi:hypothetical protein
MIFLQPDSDYLDFTAGTQVHEDCIDTLFVNQSKTGVGDAKAHPAIFGFDPKAAVLQIRQKPALRFVVGMGNLVSDHGAFTRDLTNARHEHSPEKLKMGPALL